MEKPRRAIVLLTKAAPEEWRGHWKFCLQDRLYMRDDQNKETRTIKEDTLEQCGGARGPSKLVVWVNGNDSEACKLCNWVRATLRNKDYQVVVGAHSRPEKPPKGVQWVPYGTRGSEFGDIFLPLKVGDEFSEAFEEAWGHLTSDAALRTLCLSKWKALRVLLPSDIRCQVVLKGQGAKGATPRKLINGGQHKKALQEFLKVLDPTSEDEKEESVRSLVARLGLDCRDFRKEIGLGEGWTFDDSPQAQKARALLEGRACREQCQQFHEWFEKVPAAFDKLMVSVEEAMQRIVDK